MVDVFRAVRRVLRDDGTLWLNLGDSYAAGSNNKPNTGILKIQAHHQDAMTRNITNKVPPGLKPKDLIGIPWRVAFALQADGWWLRSDIIWAKPNPMPESVTDRPTKSHEHIFLLSKSKKYYYDAEAIKEPLKESSIKRNQSGWDGDEDRGFPQGKQNHISKYLGSDKAKAETSRNKRDVWTVDDVEPIIEEIYERRETLDADEFKAWLRAKLITINSLKGDVWKVATHSFKKAHFATFPPKLIEPCILAGTSQKGCCPECGKPWERVTEHVSGVHNAQASQYQRKKSDGCQNGGINSTTIGGVAGHNKTVGWEAACKCDKAPIPCTVLDPFTGAGTTGLVSSRLGRSFIGIELNEEYCEMARRRIYDDAPLFSDRTP